VWGNWFIVTLVTHSSGVSRGIHHKCKHPLNPTFACLVVLYVVLLLLRWSSIHWCEQLREALEVNKEEMILLHSLPWLDFMFYWGFSLWLWPMYALLFSILLTFVKSLDSWLYLASWCALVSPNIFGYCKE